MRQAQLVVHPVDDEANAFVRWRNDNDGQGPYLLFLLTSQIEWDSEEVQSFRRSS